MVRTMTAPKAVVFQSTIPSNTAPEMGNAGEGLPRSMILRGQRAFQQVRDSGRRARVGDLVVFFCQKLTLILR